MQTTRRGFLAALVVAPAVPLVGRTPSPIQFNPLPPLPAWHRELLKAQLHAFNYGMSPELMQAVLGGERLTMLKGRGLYR